MTSTKDFGAFTAPSREPNSDSDGEEKGGGEEITFMPPCRMTSTKETAAFSAPPGETDSDGDGEEGGRGEPSCHRVV